MLYSIFSLKNMDFYAIKKRIPAAIKKMVKPALIRLRLYQSDSVQIFDQAIIDAFIANAENTFLVSFPRTGSHWLRMMSELYFDRPSLVRVFYYPERQNYLMLHTHDLDLEVNRCDVVYLYRDPVQTVFSQLCYHQEPLTDRFRIAYWADLYGKHLDKWLHQEQFTTHKTVLRYERMKNSLETEFEKFTHHFGQSLDKKKLQRCKQYVTKEEVKRKTSHDSQVIQIQSAYNAQREEFQNHHGSFVWDVLTKGRSHLVKYFD